MALAEAEDDVRDCNLETFANSALFSRTFDEGMSLVEETARYLDGRGRDEARDLPRKTALLYAGESMRVTTRLMQAASWLLIQRAVQDGEMRAEDAAGERYRLGSKEICLGGREEGVDALPKTLQDLLTRSDNLYRRIARLDDILFGEGGLHGAGIKEHFERLKNSFDQTGTDGQ
jgi:regulator of CtrA degradation